MPIFFDTETTGFPRAGLLHSDPKQARICQLGAIVTDDHAFVMAELNVLIQPDGWTIPDEVSRIHGITTEKAARFGVPIRHALVMFTRMLDLVEMAVAHNIPFDLGMLAIECEGAEITDVLKTKKHFCTMKATTDICKLPGKYPGKYKWPKMTEAYKHFFGTEFEGAHDAMADIRACRDVFFKLPANIIKA